MGRVVVILILRYLATNTSDYKLMSGRRLDWV